MKEEKVFCPVPWNFTALRANGDLRVCCHANQSKSQGIIRDEFEVPMNGGNSLINDARNSTMLKNIRVNMLQEKWPEECIRCQREEGSGLRSRRDYEREHWDLTKNYAEKHTDLNGKIDIEKLPLEYIDLRFGNLCNLACRMCGPADSTSWYSDYVQLHERNHFKDTHGKVVLTKDKFGKFSCNDYAWYESPIFWNQLSDLAKKIVHIYMAGGEPLLIEQHYDFLNQCIDKGWASSIVLEYNTNLTILNKRITDLWSKFKEVRVGASVDGMEYVLEYQRHPAKWNIIFENLKKLDSTGDNIKSWLAVTITNYNIFHLPEFIKWKMLKSGFKKINSSKMKPIITHHMCHSPKHLNVRSLPIELKKLVLERFNDLSQWSEETLSSNEHHALCKIIDGISRYMMGETYDDWDYFIEYTKKLDKIRNQDILKIVPEFKEYF